MAIYGHKSAPCGGLDRHDLCRVNYDLSEGSKVQTDSGVRVLTPDELVASPTFTCKCECHPSGRAVATSAVAPGISDQKGGA